MLRQERARGACFVSLSMCSRVKYLRKPSPLLQLPHELLSGRLRATIYIPGVSLRIISSFQFPTPSNVFGRDGKVEILQDRHGTFAKTGQSVRKRRGTTCKLRGATLLQDFCAARTDFAGNSQLLKLLLSVLCRLLQGEED